jgi:phosphatidylserine/phosphatidylglycerophosphate/cardiolipin synthase-like enzyme
MDYSRNTRRVLIAAFLLCLFAYAPAAHATPPIAATIRGVYFSPNGGATEAVVKEIREARSSILVQAYSFTSAPIAEALVQAHRRGVAVTVILDKSQRTEHYSAATFLAHAGIPTYIDAAHAIAHNKIILIDDATIITGSFNFTKAAEEHNAENLLVLYSTALYPIYKSNFRAHLSHSQPYTR